MNRRFCELLLCVAAALGAAFAAPASAQAPAGGTAPGTAAAGGEDLSEIVVTARRVEERAQDVPISMTIFTQQALSDRNITNAADLAAVTPSVSVDTQFGADNSAFAIRGFVQQLNTTPSVAVYFADAVGPRGGAVGQFSGGSGVAPGSFFDLQNVQVLKGPQGTLFGRNTDGGAVLLVPKKPTSQFEGYVQGAYGNYAMGQVQGVVNVPLSDNVRVRFGINHETRNGYLNNISGIGRSDFENIDYTAARLSVVVDITPDLENYTIGTYNLSINNGVLPQAYVCNPQGLTSTVFSLCPPLVAQVQQGDPYAVANNLQGAQSFVKQYQVINTTTWHATDNLTVKNIANYGLLNNVLDSGIFGGFLGGTLGGVPLGSPISSANTNPSAEGAKTTDQYTWTDELQLSGNFDLLGHKLSWQGGGYIERSGPKGNLTGSRSADFINCPNIEAFLCDGPGIVNINTSVFHYSDLAAFGQATYALLDQLKVTAGIRYTSDTTDAVVHQTNFTGFPIFPPAATFTTVACQVAGLQPSPGTSGTGCTQQLEQNSHAPTYLLGLDYTPIQDLLIYAKYTRGYRQGSVAPFTLPGFQVYAPEFVNSYELGEKFTFSGAISGTFDVTGHYNAFSDQQLLAGFVNAGVPSAGIVNAGKSRIWGIEVESTVTPWKPLTLGLSYSYLNTELQSAFVASAPPGATIIFPANPGGELPFSPKNKLSASAAYRLPVPEDIGNLSLSANFTYTSRTLVSAADPFATVGAYGLLGMNLHWNNILRSPIDGELFATNILNRVYYNNNTQLYNATPFQFDSRYLGEPRMYGIRVSIRFGNQ